MPKVTIEQVREYLLAIGVSYKPTGVKAWGCPVIEVGGMFVTEYDLLDRYKRGDL